MPAKQLPLSMMIAFFLIIVVGRIVLHLIMTGNSGIRSGTKLKTNKAMCISALLSSVLVLQLILTWLIASEHLKLIFEPVSVVTWSGLTLCAAGIVFSSFAQYSMGAEWRIGVDPDEETELVTTGIYAYVRNPIYTGCIVFGTGLLLLAPHPLFLATGLIGYFSIRAYVKEIEEPYLIELHGDDYREYQSMTGSFFPQIRVFKPK